MMRRPTIRPRLPIASELGPIREEVDSIAADTDILDEASFHRRAHAVDRLDLNVIYGLDGLLEDESSGAAAKALKEEAGRLRSRLEAVDETLFRRIRSEIREGRWRGADFERLVLRYVGRLAEESDGFHYPGYDELDAFVAALLLAKPLPSPTREPEPEMVFYQATPFRIILELAQSSRPAPGDLLVDIGSGLGQVPILMNLLTGVDARGIEVEPAYLDYARACADELGLGGVEFLREDAREADYTTGTIFFMYTPFSGEMMSSVLAKLEKEAGRREVRVYTYGPCTPVVAQEKWLEAVSGDIDDIYRLTSFRSRPGPD